MPTFTTLARESAKAAIVASLCLSVAVPQAFAADRPAPSKSRPLTSAERTVHALNRLSFGPRPGDEAAVKKMGLDAWFERQLHPETIDDSALEARLNDFPALKLSQSDLITHFPSGLRMRFYLGSNTPPPTFPDAATNAVYADYMARYKLGLRLQANGQKADGDSTAMQIAEKGSEAAPKAASVPDMGTDGRNPGSMDTANSQNRRAQRASGLVTAATEKLPPATITPEDIRAITALPPQERFDRIVALTPQDNLRFVITVAPRLQEVLAGFTPEQKETIGAMINPARVVAAETLEARLLRDIYSERQLQAVMTDFWLNHFSVYLRKSPYELYLLNSYQKDAILPNALGNFEQLLIATAKSPAMLMYLDNWQSVGPDSPFANRTARAKKFNPDNPTLNRASAGINENYARELMELHTVGVNGGYTQKDVIEVARCFTGWTINRPYGATDGNDIQAFTFDARKHAAGPKVVMGVTIPEGGMQEGLTVLHLLATSPRTAHFISEKLAVRFVSDTPPPSLVDKMAATFLKSNGNIPAVLSTMFHAPEFWSPTVYRAKVKTPIEFLVSALRASDANVSNAGLLVQAADRLGMPVYGMQTPNGYSWKSEDWVSSGALVNRMNFALVFSGDHVRGTRTDWQKLLAEKTDPAAPTSATEKNLEFLILGEEASAKTRATVLDQFRNDAVQQEAQKNFALVDKPADPDEPADMANPQARRRRPVRAYQQGNGLSLNAQPATPLDTMAGLLLGSPDFQRR